MKNELQKMVSFLRAASILISTIMVFYHAIYAFYVYIDLKRFILGHLGFALIIMSLGWLIKAMETKDKKSTLIELCFLFSSVVTIGYMFVNCEQLQIRGEYFATSTDAIIGIIFLLSIFRMTYKQYGAILPVIAILLFTYALFGRYFPGMLKTTETTLPILLSKLTTSLGDQGVFGIILTVSAMYVFMFLVFGAFVQETGVSRFFDHLGNLVAQKFKSGPALATVVSCGLMGSLTGQVGADITVAGSYTIQAMKKMGYKPEEAGGILAAAGTAGPIVPPVMGIVAFIMSGITGIPYSKIVFVAILPAILYVIAVGMAVEIQARKINISGVSEKPDMKEFFVFMPIFLISLATIIFSFMKGKSPLIVGCYASIVIAALSIITEKTRLEWREFLNVFCKAAELGSSIGVTCALLGIVVGVLEITGLAMKLPILIGNFCGDNMILLLIMTGMVSIILGCGMPASASYILVAVIMCPTMIKLGVPLLSAHFFSFYFANFSYITPPVALAAVFAAKLAGGDYIKTGIAAVKYGFPAFIIPFAFIWAPGILGDFRGNFLVEIIKICSLVFSIFSLILTVFGYFFTRISLIVRIITAALSFVFYYTIYSNTIIPFFMSAALLAILLIWHVKRAYVLRHHQVIRTPKV